MNATVEDIKDAVLVVKTIGERINAGTKPTPENVELCEQYIVDLSDLGLAASSLAVEDALNDWCELLLDA
tara:strand:- start:3784 stop:3993 length:210 start_codon:yes stop_codon:yes gene_type:complete